MRTTDYIFIRLRNLFISPKNKIPICGFMTGWWTTNWCFSLSFLISTWELWETFRITMFWKYNKKRKLVSLSVSRMRIVPLQKRLEKYCDKNWFLWIETVIMFFSYHSMEIKVNFVLYIYFWHRWFFLQASVTTSPPPDPNSFFKAVLTSMVKTVLWLLIRIAFSS